jgi:L-malate glycosyltransferase
MKKILFYTDTPQTGGAELQMYLLAKFLNKEKFTPIIAISNYEKLDQLTEQFEKENIKVIRIPVKHKHDPKHYFQLKKILKKEEIDLMHVHVWNPASCRYAFRAANSEKIPIITTEHDPFKLSPIKNIIKKRSLPKINKIIAISNDNKRLLQELYPKHRHKIQTIHNGIDTTWWQSQLLRFHKDDRQKIKEQIFHARENTLIVITVAELHERKGINYLIEAVPNVVEKYPNLKFVLVGDGPHRKRFESLVQKLKIENHVTFTGQQKNIPQLLKSSDIFCLPSKREGFGLVNLEAMITPLPVVASRVGGIPDIVKNKETGLLVNPEDSEALARSLMQLIASPKMREKMASEGQKRVMEKFDVKKMAKRYERVYEELLRK